MRRLLPAAVAAIVLAWGSAAPADDPEVPEKFITADEAKALLDEKKPVVFIDVRPRQQYADLHIRGALSIPLQELPKRVAEVTKRAPVVLY
jgi:rhodanese-related sulfurtransferase